MKPRSLLKKRPLLLVLITILFILMGCFYVPSSSKQYSRNQTNVSSKDISRFFSKIRPSHAHIESQYRYAIHLQKIGKHRISVEVLKDIARFEPDNPRIYNALGIAYDTMTDFNKANQAYQKALKLDPDLDYVHNNLGYSQLLQADYGRAKKSFRRAISSAGRNRDIGKYENNLALANANSGAPDETIVKNEEAVEKKVRPVPASPPGVEKITIANDDLKQPQADLSAIEETIQVPKDAVVPKVHPATVDTTTLYWEEDRDSADVPVLENDSTRVFSDNSNLVPAKMGVAPEKEMAAVPVAPEQPEIDIIADGGVRQSLNDLGVTEKPAQIPENKIDPAPEANQAAETTDLYQEKYRAPTDFPDVKMQYVSYSFDTLNPNVDKVETRPEKEVPTAQAGRIMQFKEAENLKHILSDEMNNNIYVSKVQIQKKPFYRVKIAPFNKKTEPEDTIISLKNGKGVSEFSPKKTISSENRFYSVQVGAMRQLNNAEKLKRVLSDKVENIYVSKVQVEGRRYYRVRVGPFNNKLDAENARNQLKSTNDIKGFIACQSSDEDTYNHVKYNETLTQDDFSGYKAGIEVSNGNGINRMARRVGNFLSQKGFNIIRLTNAIAFNVKKTVIYFTREYRDEALSVENQFPGDQIIQEMRSNDRPGVQVKIVIGHDLKTHDKKLFDNNFQANQLALNKS